MKKVVILAFSFVTLHLAEDLLWLSLGRYTDIPYGLIILAIVILGIIGGISMRHPKIKKFLGE